jgi:hypothetical protein
MMDHSQAIESQAAERYLLGELTAVEAEDFERHYFECQQCVAAVESATQFIANVKVVSKEPLLAEGREPPQRISWWNVAAAWWRPAAALSLAATVVFGAVALYQGLIVIPGMRQGMETALALPAFQLTGAARGEEPLIRVRTGTLWVALSQDIPPDVHYPQYLCVLISAGQPVFHVLAPAPAAGQPITILVPVPKLRSGEYQLVIYGPNGSEGDKITTYPFRFQLQ